MKIIATCGHEWSGYEQVHAALAAAGVAPALSATPFGSQQGSTISQFHELLLRAHKVDATAPGTSIAPISPGSLWQQLAANLFMANIHQDQWGWCDTRSLWLVDFWAQFDANLHFVLVFSSPETAIARLLEAGSSSPQAVNACLDSWVAYNDELLRCYHRHASRCLLVEAHTVSTALKTLQEHLCKRFDMSLQLVAPPSEPPSPLKQVAASLARDLLDQRPDTTAVYHELRASADVVSPQSGEESFALQALALLASQGAEEKQLLLAQLSQVQENAERYFLEHQKLVNEKSAKDTLLQERQARIEALTKEKAALAQEKDTLLQERQARIEALTKEKAALAQEFQLSQQASREMELAATHECDLLKTQLRQVEEELKNYYKDYQRVANGEKAATQRAEFLLALWKSCHPLEVCLDLRGPFEGSNWYDAEVDGRWAGPGHKSSILLLELRPGQYLLHLDIVDAIDPAIISALRCELNGVPLPFQAPEPCHTLMLTIPFDTQNIPPRPIWELQLTFSHLVSPAASGTSEDSRTLAIRVQSVRFLSLAETSPNPVVSGASICSK